MKKTDRSEVVYGNDINIIGRKGNGNMTASIQSKKLKVSFWHVCLFLIGIYTLFWLVPALMDWVWGALFGTYSSFPDLGQYGFVDKVALILLKYHRWIFLVMVGLNVLATVVCFLAVRNRSFTIPLLVYVVGFIIVGISIIFCDVRLYQIGLNAGEEAFIMTGMWCILSVPLWLFTAKGVWNIVSGQLAPKTLKAIA